MMALFYDFIWMLFKLSYVLTTFPCFLLPLIFERYTRPCEWVGAFSLMLVFYIEAWLLENLFPELLLLVGS